MRSLRSRGSSRLHWTACLVALLSVATAASGFEISSHEHRQGCGEDRPADERAPHVHAAKGCTTCLIAHQSLRSPSPIAEASTSQPVESHRAVLATPPTLAVPAFHRSPRAPPSPFRG